MATFDDLEVSVETSKPIELYTFTIGTEVFRYTSSEGTISFGGADYTELSLKRSNPQISREQKLTTVTVTLPSNSDPAQFFVSIQPASRMTVDILRIQPDAAPIASIVMFEGFVSSVAFKDEVAEMRLIPFNELFTRETPRFQYQGLCNHILYDTRCKVLETSFMHSGTVLDVNGNEVTVQGLPSAGDPFVGGFLEVPDKSEQRLILAQSGTLVTLLLPFSQNISGGTIDAYQGCDHTAVTCAQKFNNIINYGGFPYVPTSNPFQLTQFTKE